MSELGSSNFDPTMLELFRAEVDIHLPVLSNGILALEKGQANPKEVESMMRAAHSIKGAARIVGNEPAVRVAHIMEDCFTLAKEARVTLSGDSVDILLSGVDALERICLPDPTVNEEFIQGVLARIATLRDGKPAPAKTPEIITVAKAEAPVESSILLPAIFDDKAAENVRVQLCKEFARTPASVRLDFSAVNHLSVAAMALLLSFVRQAKSTQPSPIVEAQHVTPPVRALFRVVGLESAFAVTD